MKFKIIFGRSRKELIYKLKRNTNPRGDMLSRPANPFYKEFAVDLSRMAKRITNIYDADDTVFIFVGASPAYLYYYFRFCIPEYNCALLPISYLSSLQQGLRPQDYGSFSVYLSLFVNIYRYSKIVVIDHSHTGKSIIELIKLLWYAGRETIKNIQFCDLIDNITAIDEDYMKSMGIRVPIKIVKGSFVNDVSGHRIPRLTQQIDIYQLEGKSKEEMRNFLNSKNDQIIEGLRMLVLLKPLMC